MAAPQTATTLAKLGYEGYQNTTLCNRFDNTYRAWTTQALAAKYGRLPVAAEVFTLLLKDIRENGIHRTEKTQGLSFHTLLFTRARGIFSHLLRKDEKTARTRYEESESAIRQPTRRSEDSSDKEELDNEVLRVAYALLSDRFMETVYYPRFKPEQLTIWRLYVETNFSGTKTAQLMRCAECRVSRAKQRVGSIIVVIARENISERHRREKHAQGAS